MIQKILLKGAICAFLCIPSMAADEVELFPAKVNEWKQCGPGRFIVEKDIATCEGGMGMWWYAAKSYANATFDVVFSLGDVKWNSGIFVRFPDQGNDPWVAVRKGYECQISGDKNDKHSTGSIFDIQAPTEVVLKKPGEWNHYRITTWNNKIIIAINGKLVNVFTAQPGRGDKDGYIGLQNHDSGSKVTFRKVTVREWPADITLAQVLKKVGITQEEWKKYHAANKQ